MLHHMFSFCLVLLLSGVSWDEMHTQKQHPLWTTVGGYYTILWPHLLYFSPRYFLPQVPGLVQGWSSKLKPNQLHTQVVRLECVWIWKSEKCFTLERFQKVVGKIFREKRCQHKQPWAASGALDPFPAHSFKVLNLLFFRLSTKPKEWRILSTKEG